MNRRMKWLALVLGILFVTLAVAGCAPQSADESEEVTVQAEVPGDSGVVDLAEPISNVDEADGGRTEDFEAAPAEEEMTGPVADAPSLEIGGDGDMAAVAPPADGLGSGEGAEVRSDDVAGEVLPPPQATQAPDQQFRNDLSAGEINDNELFDEYLQYRIDYQRFVGGDTVHDVDISQRHIIQVTNGQGLPVLGATVEFYSGQRLLASLQTPATGIVYFHPLAYSARVQGDLIDVVVSKGQVSTSGTVDLGDDRSIQGITLDVPSTQSPVQLDVMFLIDSTGSMDDEIDQLKENILSVSAQIEALPASPDVRFGMVTYRDRGDLYVTQVYDFTGNVQAFQRDLQGVQAAGGGDTPESMNEGLHRAIWDVSWRVEDTVSLIFLVADAPPQLNYSQDYDYAQEMVNAASMGIKIIPISSFLDEDFYADQAEYIFRQMAQFTGGNFVFLTYQSQPQSDGEAGRDVSVDEQSYTVEDLDALVVRLVRDELAALSGQQ